LDGQKLYKWKPISARLAGRTNVRWESNIRDLRIVNIKKLDKMHPGSVK
jgi:hypothetical protein